MQVRLLPAVIPNTFAILDGDVVRAVERNSKRLGNCVVVNVIGNSGLIVLEGEARVKAGKFIFVAGEELVSDENGCAVPIDRGEGPALARALEECKVGGSTVRIKIL